MRYREGGDLDASSIQNRRGRGGGFGGGRGVAVGGGGHRTGDPAQCDTFATDDLG